MQKMTIKLEVCNFIRIYILLWQIIVQSFSCLPTTIVTTCTLDRGSTAIIPNTWDVIFIGCEIYCRSWWFYVTHWWFKTKYSSFIYNIRTCTWYTIYVCIFLSRRVYCYRAEISKHIPLNVWVLFQQNIDFILSLLNQLMKFPEQILDILVV